MSNPQLNKNQEGMLNFLRHTTEKHPLDLNTAYDLNNSANRATFYKDHLELTRMNYIKDVGEKHCITEEGLKALEAHIEKLIKANQKK